MNIIYLNLTQGDLRNAFDTPANPYGPVLSLIQAAELGKMAPGTLKRKVSEGAFVNSVKRGKPLRFWRDRFIVELMK